MNNIMIAANYTVQDILLGVIAHRPEGYKGFRWNDEEIQTFFYDRQPRRDLHSPHTVLREMVFDPDGLQPTSRDLHEALNFFNGIGILTSLSPMCDVCLLTGSVDIGMERLVEQKVFNERELDQLRILGNDFYEEFGVRSK